MPEAEEALLLDIADQEGVKDNEEGHTGHNWVVTAAAKNLCIKCTMRSLCAEVVDLVLSHPCKRRLAEPLATAGIHPSHLTLNLGHQAAPGTKPTILFAPGPRNHFRRSAKAIGKKGDRSLLQRPGFPVLRVLLPYLLVELLPVRPNGLQILRLNGPKLCFWLEILSPAMAQKSFLLVPKVLRFRGPTWSRPSLKAKPKPSPKPTA